VRGKGNKNLKDGIEFESIVSPEEFGEKFMRDNDIQRTKMEDERTKSDIVLGVIGIIAVIFLIGVSIWAAFNADPSISTHYDFIY
jgi:hypothetical protein